MTRMTSVHEEITCCILWAVHVLVYKFPLLCFGKSRQSSLLSMSKRKKIYPGFIFIFVINTWSAIFNKSHRLLHRDNTLTFGTFSNPFQGTLYSLRPLQWLFHNNYMYYVLYRLLFSPFFHIHDFQIIAIF